MIKEGTAPNDIFGKKIHGHHHKQQFHREPGAFIVEIPKNKHQTGHRVQHPLGNKGGLTTKQRQDWDKLREKYWQERAKTELNKRILNDRK